MAARTTSWIVRRGGDGLPRRRPRVRRPRRGGRTVRGALLGSRRPDHPALESPDARAVDPRVCGRSGGHTLARRIATDARTLIAPGAKDPEVSSPVRWVSAAALGVLLGL